MRLTVQDVIEQGLVGKVDVQLNGESVRHCIEADEEAGYVVAYETDDRGKIRIDRGPGMGEGWPRVTRSEGVVTIRIREAAPVGE